MADVLPSIRVTDSQSNLQEVQKDSSAASGNDEVDPLDTTPSASDKPAQSTLKRKNKTSPATTPTRPEAPPDSATSTDSRQLSSHSAIDPLSEHIWKRTSPQTQLANRPRRPSDAILDALPAGVTKETGSAKNSTEVQRVEGSIAVAKDKKKGVAFLSRFRASKKKEVFEEAGNHAEDTENTGRLKGAEAEAFYQSFDNMGFSPTHLQPPGYIKVHAQDKKKKEFDRLFLAQELGEKAAFGSPRRASTFSTASRLSKSKSNGGEATWAMEFSGDGKYLATGGQDKIVRVWATLASREERRLHERDEEAHDDFSDANNHNHLSAPVFRSKPFRIYQGHTSPVLDLSWSKNNFLLSSSMDKTVRLWHVSRSECLCAFKHTDFVTSIVFHPRDDRFFLAGSLDSKLRLWSIPDKRVAYWNQMSEMCTAVAFTPDGKTSIAGCLNGLCLLYETEGLKYQTQIHVKSSYGKNARGSKITGIQTINMPPADPTGDIKLLITSNDSRIRMYNLRDKSLEMKFKGTENTSSQIHARFSDDGKFIICGSEDNKVFIWPLSHGDPEKKDKRPVEVFEAHKAATTVCAIAPARTRQLLNGSEDPIYDLCNPPPVTLVSKSEVESVHSSRTPDDASSVQQTPAAAEGNGSFKRQEESPAYVARSSHPGGLIIVTADATGCVKVFRQDCAFEKRMRSDSESLTRRFSAVGALRRHSSLATQSSSRSRSRHESASQPSRERILSWRQSISHSSGLESPKASSSPHPSSHNNGRSQSPRKSLGGRFSHRSLLAEHQGPSRSPAMAGTPPMSTADTQSIRRSSLETGSSGSRPAGNRKPLSEARRDRSRPQLVVETTNAQKEPNTEPQSAPLESTQPQQPQPQPQPQPQQQQQDKEQQDPSSRSHDEQPRLEREKSMSYWRYDAWRDTIMKQLQGSQLRPASTPSAAASARSAAADHGGSSASAASSANGDPLHLRPPLKSSGSALSDVSLLSSELESGSDRSGERAAAAHDEPTAAAGAEQAPP